MSEWVEELRAVLGGGREDRDWHRVWRCVRDWPPQQDAEVGLSYLVRHLEGEAGGGVGVRPGAPRREALIGLLVHLARCGVAHGQVGAFVADLAAARAFWAEAPLNAADEEVLAGLDGLLGVSGASAIWQEAVGCLEYRMTKQVNRDAFLPRSDEALMARFVRHTDLDLAEFGRGCLVWSPSGARFCLEHKVVPVTEVARTLVREGRLCLSGRRGLERLPGAFGELQEVRELTVQFESLREVDPGFGRLRGLERLTFENTGLRDLPKELVGLESLRELNLWGGGFRAIPQVVYALPALERFKFTSQGEGEEHVPGALGRLQSLRELELVVSRIRSLPPELGELGQLERLKLHGMHLQGLPATIGRLTGLRELSIVASFELDGLPAELERCVGLRALSVGYWRKPRLPEVLFGMSWLRSLSVICDVSLEEGEEARLRRALRGTSIHVGYTATVWR